MTSILSPAVPAGAYDDFLAWCAVPGPGCSA